jgi:hypothetical protein
MEVGRMSTRQQEIWMAMAVAESDGSAQDIERRFTRKVINHPGAFQIPRLDEQQQAMVDDQALHDVFASRGFPATELDLQLFDSAVERRRQELGHIMRASLLHRVIQAELWVRRTMGYPSQVPA